jgi:tetratricopeptide (TPR) repeat protein
LIAAATTGLLFGVHPIHVESVVWVAERKDLLCALFYLLSVITYVKYAACKTYRTYLICLIFFTLALLSKPMAVTLPFVLLILDWYPFRRIQSLSTFRPVFIEKLPFIALSLISSVLTILAQKAGGAMEMMQAESLSTRLLVAAKALIAYLWNMIMPVNLTPFYSYPKVASLLFPEYFISIFLILGITVSCLLASGKRKFWMSCWAYYVITLIPVLGVVQVGYQAMADRYTYLPALGPFLIAGLSVAWVFNVGKTRFILYFSAASAILVIASLSYASFKQVGIWKNNIDLWTYVIDKDPSGYAGAYNNRGSAFNNMGQFDKAVEDYNKAIALNPSYGMAYRNRGSAYLNIGRPNLAIEDYNRPSPGPSAAAYYERGLAFEQYGQTDKAIEDYSSAVELKPSSLQVHVRLGVLYGKSGAFEKAIDEFNRAVTINPEYSLAYSNRGFAYSLMGQNDLAIRDLSRAIELDKNDVGSYINRGKVYRKTGRKELAIRDFLKACDMGDKEGCNMVSMEKIQR